MFGVVAAFVGGVVVVLDVVVAVDDDVAVERVLFFSSVFLCPAWLLFLPGCLVA